MTLIIQIGATPMSQTAVEEGVRSFIERRPAVFTGR
jgi:hypothetical protein